MVELMPKVSVIIPIYNAEKFISKTIESVIAQTYPDWEIIAVDDGSTDKTPAILNEYKKKLSKKLRIITQKNSGVSIARNTGIAAAEGKYIAFLDHDDLWTPEKLEKQVKLLDSNKELGLVYSDSYVIDGAGNLKKDTIFHGVKPFRGNVFNKLFYNNFIPCLTVVTRKEVLDKVGLFNLEYKIAEEYDLFLKIAERCSIDFIEQPLAKYRIHGESFSKNIEIAVDEDFQIITYWLKKKPDLKKELKYAIKLKNARLRARLIKYHLKKHEIKKTMQALLNLTKVIFG